MKKLALIIFLLFFTSVCVAQSGISYKALIKDDNGNVLASSPVSIQFIIYEGAALTNNVYQESHTINTDANGFAIVNIGQGTTSDDFNTINWSSDEHFLNVQVNIGSGLIDLGTTQFMAVPYALNAANVSGLEYLDETDDDTDNGGWRIKGRNPDNYGVIGEDAVDMSLSGSPTDENGATGRNSTAFGEVTIASGTYSTAMGINTEATRLASTAMGYSTEATGAVSTAMGRSTNATGDYSTAMGFSTDATGTYSTAMGLNTEATGSNSTAFGEVTIASGNYSTAMGFGTSATGDYSTAMGLDTEATGVVSTAMGTTTNATGDFSTAMGRNTIAPSYAETAIGVYNLEYTPNNTVFFNENDRLFTIGNGISNTNRSNALTVLKNGNIGIGTDSPEELLHLEGILRIGTETIEDTGFNRLSFDASLLPNVNNDTSLGSTDFRWNTVYATNGTINTSDRREKKNIKNLNYGLNEVLQMKPVSFNWKNTDNPDLKLGLIAQDLQALIPEVVKSHTWETDEITGQLTKKELERLGVYYSDLVPVLIKAIQEQNKIIESQSDELKASNKNYKTLLSRVEQLESKSSN